MHFLKLVSQQSIGPKVIIVSSQRTDRWMYFNIHLGFGETMPVGWQYKIFYHSPSSPSVHLNYVAWHLLQCGWVNLLFLNIADLERKSVLIYCLRVENGFHIDNLAGLGYYSRHCKIVIESIALGGVSRQLIRTR